jgi:hypothetical protein
MSYKRLMSLALQHQCSSLQMRRVHLTSAATVLVVSAAASCAHVIALAGSYEDHELLWPLA